MSFTIKKIAVFGSLVLVGCSSGSAVNEDSSWNAADQKFVQEMIPHHEQAVVMSQMVTNTQVSPGVAELATKISQAQAGEIQQMQGFLVEWDVKIDAHGGHTMTDDMNTGMMTDEDLDKLKNSSVADFEKMWLTMMLAHHNGAITMATAVITEGKDSRVKTLAENIIGAQQKEILLIRSLLGT